MASNRSIWPAAAWLIFRFPRAPWVGFVVQHRPPPAPAAREDLQIMDRRVVITGNQNIQHGIDTLGEQVGIPTSDLGIIHGNKNE